VATFSAVTRQHVLQAIAEYDDRGREAFIGVYGFPPSAAETLVHEGRTYDSRAVLGVAHRYATGRLAPSEEVGGDDVTAELLRRNGFEVTGGAVPTAHVKPARATASAATRPAARTTTKAATRTTRRPSLDDRPAAICPTCFTQLPATGVCDTCG
jgi:hypothetical protein